MAIIGTIRKHSGIAVAVVGIAIIAFIIGDVFKRQNSRPDFAKIDGETILDVTFDTKVKETEERFKRQSGKDQLTNDESFQLREQVWNEILEEKILGKQYEKLGITVTDKEMEDMFVGEFIHPYLRQIPAFNDPNTGQYNAQGVAQFLRNFDQISDEEKQTWLDIETYVRQSRILEKYNLIMARSFYTPKAMGSQIAALGANDVDARVVALSTQTVKDEEIKVTDEDLKNFYEKNKNMFKQEDARDIDFVMFPVIPTQKDMDDIADSVGNVWSEFQNVEDEYIGSYVNQVSDRWYDSTFMKASDFAEYMGLDSAIERTAEGKFVNPMLSNQTWVMAKVLKVQMRPDSLRASAIHILNNNVGEGVTRSEAEAASLADSVEALVKSGKMPFEEAVMQFSDDPQKNETFGDLKWAPDGSMGFLNEKIIETPVGGVFKYERPDKLGYMIVKVTGKTPENKKYRVALITRKIEASEDTYNAVSDKANKFLANCANHDQFISLAQSENLMVRNADFTPSNVKSLQGISEARDIVRWAFDENRKEGDVMDKVHESDNNCIVASLKTIRKKGIATFEQVRSYIEPQVRNEKKVELLAEKAEKALASNKDINSFAAQMQATVDSVTALNFNSYSFGMYGPEMKAIGKTATAKKTGMLKPIKGTYGVYVVYVDAITPRAEQIDGALMAQQMEMESTQKLRSLFNVLKDRAKIVDNRIVFY
ncbi:MAG: SurA N-terminal domain-containing protein [Bacteroidales bacterium]|nr:SurA N-terminal domain-containing protein [Bacteroidales bacterium]